MAKRIKVSVRFGDRVYNAAVERNERADQLLLRSLYHFGIAPEEKGDYRLAYEGEERTDRGVYLDHPIGDQVQDGGRLILQEDVAGNRRPSTGSY